MSVYTHRCRARGCMKTISVGKLMCAKHWGMLPAAIQNNVNRTYHALTRKNANIHAYTGAVRAAVEAVATAEEQKQEVKS